MGNRTFVLLASALLLAALVAAAGPKPGQTAAGSLSFEGEQKILYAFDSVEVLYAARFTVYPAPDSVASWADEIAAPGEGIDITYGIVILKSLNASNELVETAREEWLKAEGSRGARRLLSNSVSNSFDAELKRIYMSKTQLWTAKKLIGSSIEKDFTEPVYNAYLFRRLRAGEMVPTAVCFRTGANFDDFWAKSSTADCYITERIERDVGNAGETTGQAPPNAPQEAKPKCPDKLSCLAKETGDSRGCVVIASFACENQQEQCFNCNQISQPGPTPAAPEAQKPKCPEHLSCLAKETGGSRGCVVMGDFSCENNQEQCFDCSKAGQPTVSPAQTPTPTTAPTSCTDSDGGKDYFIRGGLSGSLPYNPNGYTDYCMTNSALMEYYCDGSEPLATLVSCDSLNTDTMSYHCSYGICAAGQAGEPSPKAPPEQTPTPTPTPEPSPTIIPNSCTDSDGGLDYLTKGNVTGYNGQAPYVGTDYCQPGGAEEPVLLSEWFCSGPERNGTLKNCADLNTESANYSCVDGACRIA
jgi:hypothetical protein